MMRSNVSDNIFSHIVQSIELGYGGSILFLCNKCGISFYKNVVTEQDVIDSMMLGCPICNDSNFTEVISFSLGAEKKNKEKEFKQAQIKLKDIISELSLNKLNDLTESLTY